MNGRIALLWIFYNQLVRLPLCLFHSRSAAEKEDRTPDVVAMKLRADKFHHSLNYEAIECLS